MADKQATGAEERIRKEAEELAASEGHREPTERDRTEAKEAVAVKENYKTTLQPVSETVEEQPEPSLAFEQQGDMPGLDDLGGDQPGPAWDAARETAEVRSVSVDEDAPEHSETPSPTEPGFEKTGER